MYCIILNAGNNILLIFKHKILLQKFNFESLRQYYNILQTQNQHLLLNFKLTKAKLRCFSIIVS